MSVQHLSVLFDSQIFVEQAAGGISRYYTMLATDLNAEVDVSARIVAPFHRNEILASTRGAPVLGLALPNRTKIARLCSWMQMATSPLLSRLMSADIVHETYFSTQPYLTSTKRRVTTVYDMIHEIFYPENETSQRKKAAVTRCDHVFCISHNTKKDLCEIFGFPPERASVTHIAHEDFGPFAGQAAPDSLAGAPYFLFVGNRTGHKNFDTFLRAFAASPLLMKEFHIACFGGGRLTANEQAAAQQIGVPATSLIHLPGGDSELGAAYANAAGLVYPSLYEGFGLPPLEAMSVGCPVICSNNSSLPEVVGEAALLCNPKDAEALRDAMERIVQSNDLRQRLVREGYAQCGNFSRARTAKQTLAIYRSLI